MLTPWNMSEYRLAKLTKSLQNICVLCTPPTRFNLGGAGLSSVLGRQTLCGSKNQKFGFIN